VNIVKKLREEKNLTQDDLANILGISRQMVSAIERGANPSVELLNKLADYFGVSTDSLLGREASNNTA